MVDRYYALTMLTVVRLPLSTLYSWDIPVRIMGGRHSYGGYCSHAGVVLDSAGSEFVVIGGLCPAIGVVGFTVGGGYNSVYSRSYGLAVDNVLKMTHKIHRINETNLPTGQISYFNISWNNPNDFRAVFHNWIQFLNEVANADTRINIDVVVFTGTAGPFILFYGSFNGPHTDFQSVFESWLSKDPKPNSRSVNNFTQSEVIDIAGTANYPFPVKERQHIVSAMAVSITEAMNTTFTMLQYIGIIYLHNTNKDKNTAWPFPDISFDIAPGFAWFTVEDDATAINVAESWLKRLTNAASPSKSIVGGYLNYIDPYLDNWQELYYRDHWDRLREINGVWDPTWYFRFPQGIPPSSPKANTSSTTHVSMMRIIFLACIAGLLGRFFHSFE